MKSSCHSLIPFLPLLSTQFNYSATKLISRQTGVSKLDSSILDYSLFSTTTPTLPFSTTLCYRTLLYNHFARIPQKTSYFIALRVFATPLGSNGRGADHIENSLFIVEAFTAVTCLPSRCLAIGLYIINYT
jgi:hypothetical protein